MFVRNVPIGAVQRPGMSGLCGCRSGMGCQCNNGLGVFSFSDYTTGLFNVVSPSSWGSMLASGNWAQIAGLVTVPLVAAFALFGGSTSGRRRR